VPALGYASVPADLLLNGPEVEEQVLVIESACQELGLALVDVVRDREPDGSADRPGLSYALERLDAGEASCLVVSDLERLTRDVTELASVVDRLERARIRLVAIDMGLDTATASGRLAVSPREGTARARDEEKESVSPDSELQETTSRATAARQHAASPPARQRQPEEPAATHAGEAVRALAYASVNGDKGTAELEAQKRAIDQCATRLNLELVEVVREREPEKGKALERAGLSYLIERIAAGDASCLVVTGLDRLSRSVAELGTIVQWLERNGVRLVVVDLDLDTADPAGRATARALASVAGWERERLSERTRKGLAAARSKRRAASGSSAAGDWSDIRKRIAAMRADGMTLQAIADVLNRERVPTPRGGVEWRPSSVQTAAGYRRRTRPKKVEDLPRVEKPTRRPPSTEGGRSSK
jgi:DNA invertase Pin-like site-specific DNA recombinase